MAYRLFDEVWQTPILLLAGDAVFRVLAVYVPEANIVLSHDPSGSNRRWPTLTGDFFHHMALHGASIVAYLEADGATPMHFWRGMGALHLGHVLWNDLSGIEGLVSTVRSEQLPQFMLCDMAAGPEMYGPFERIFPELQGKVVRCDDSFVALIGSFYENNKILFRSSRTKVTKALRDRILCIVPNTIWASAVIILGLRTENRTLADLVEHLGDLRLYSDARTMDSLTEVVFAPREATRDLPESPLLLSYRDGFEPTICNVEIDFEERAKCLDVQVAAWLPQALEGRPPAVCPPAVFPPGLKIHATSLPVPA